MQRQKDPESRSDRQSLSAIRTYFEASIPAWSILVSLIFITRGEVYGNLALLNLLAVAFSGIWSALRLPESDDGLWTGIYLRAREKREVPGSRVAARSASGDRINNNVTCSIE